MAGLSGARRPGHIAGMSRRRPGSAGVRQVQGVPTATGLGGEVTLVRLVQVDSGRLPAYDVEAERRELAGLVRVVAEQGELGDPEREQHLGRGGVVALVLAVA